MFLPVVASDFWLFQGMGWTVILGMIGLSLMFLAGYGGMVSLLQMSIAGMAGYMIAILGPSGVLTVSLGLSWWIVLPADFLIAAIFATVSGALAVRTEGIYTIMITLAIGVAFYYLVLQNYSVFNGFQGLCELKPPTVRGVNWRDPLPFYFLCLFWAMAAPYPALPLSLVAPAVPCSCLIPPGWNWPSSTLLRWSRGRRFHLGSESGRKACVICPINGSAAMPTRQAQSLTRPANRPSAPFGKQPEAPAE